MKTRWHLRPHDRDRVERLSRAARIPAVAAQILLHRGIEDAEQAIQFLHARKTSLEDPERLPGAVEAAERIVRAVRDQRPILIYGDYDVDGVCGTSILWMCLKLAGASGVTYYIPHRVDEGYGLNGEALEAIAKRYPGALVVTVDCGVTSIAEARLARKLGIELIITDHHTIGSELPPADVVVHPKRDGDDVPFGELCGAGVAFKLAWQVCKAFGDGKKASPRLRDFLVEAIGLVALATVADMVPLEEENRIFVRHGLSGIQTRPSVGLKALMEVSDCLGKRRLSSGAVGFRLAPRINAAGRLEQARLAVEMLTTTEAARAAELAQTLDEANRRRQEIEHDILGQARALIEARGRPRDRGALVVGDPAWHPGVIGIVAGRLAELYHRPAIVVSLRPELCQGSGRSIAGFDLHRALQTCSGRLLAFGGHRAAAGIKLRPEDFDAFATEFDAHCQERLTPELLERSLEIDAEVRLAELSLRTVEWLEKLEPYGIGNPKPVLLASDVSVVGTPRPVGSRENHLQIRFSQQETVVKAIGWNLAERFQSLAPGDRCSIAFLPTINEWNGRREVQLELRDIQKADDPAGSRSPRLPEPVHSGSEPPA